jgi:hypothetical protein
MKAFVVNLKDRHDRLTGFKENQFPFDIEIFEGIKTDPGWIGCTESQLSIIREQRDLPFAIFEDDCLLIESWDIVEKAMSQLPDDWDALWIGATLMKPIERYSDNLFRLKEGLCAHAIIYNSKRIVDYILNNFDLYENERRKTIDVFYAYDVQEKFNCFITYPLVATQRAGFSDIENMEVDYTQIIDHFNAFTC